jgi:DNA-binding Xre family transcriptional regulator
LVRASGSCGDSAGAISLSNVYIIHLLHTLRNYNILILHTNLTGRRAMSTQTLVKVDGQKLRKLRERRLWLIGRLAEESGVHRNVISKLENGRGGAHPDTIRKLAKALDVDPTELLGG